MTVKLLKFISSNTLWVIGFMVFYVENIFEKKRWRTVWKSLKFTLTLFWQTFRESNVFATEVTKDVDFTKYLGKGKFLAFPHWKKKRWCHFFTTSIIGKLYKVQTSQNGILIYIYVLRWKENSRRIKLNKVTNRISFWR